MTAPDPLSSGSYGENTAIVSLAASTGSYTQTGHTVIGVLPPIRQESGAFVALSRYTYDGGLTWYIRGVLPGESIGTWTWANLQTLNATTYDGCVALVTGIVADLSNTGSDARSVLMVARNGRWRYLNGEATIKSLPAQLSTTRSGTTETVDVQAAFPAGLLKTGDFIDIEWASEKSATSETATRRYRFGTAGTTGDTQLVSIAQPATTNRTQGERQRFRVESATSVRKLGTGNDPSAWQGTNAVVAPTAIAVSNMDSNAMTLSCTVAMSAAVETLRTTAFTAVHVMN